MLLEKPQANMMVDTDPLLEVPINMINLTWAEKGKGQATWEVKAERRQVDSSIEGTIKLPEKPKATIVKRLVLCSKCQCECELEVTSLGVIIDQEFIRRNEKEEQEARRSIMQTVEKETSRNVFQGLGRDSQPKGLSEVFRDYEVFEEVEDREAKIPKWVDVRPPQPSYIGGDVRIKERIVNPITKKNHT
ncbi:hypothetical protein ACFXTH_014954 [Malus domestica]